MIIDGLEYVSMTEAAEIVQLSNDRLGRLMYKYFIPNGLRVRNTSKNNKGIKICKADIEMIVEVAAKCNLRLIDIILTK